MIPIKSRGAQGDVFFRRVDHIPPSAILQKRTGKLLVAHSETGHHHTIDETGVCSYADPADPLVCYLQLSPVGYADVVHERAWDTHETLRLLGGPDAVWEVRRQREWAPEGWRRVED